MTGGANGATRSRLTASYAPDKLLADGAEGRLREEGGAELVALHQVDLGLLDGASPLVEREHAVPALLGLQANASLTGGIWNTSDMFSSPPPGSSWRWMLRSITGLRSQ